jgi:putative oligomerization/nucleic acid binding protein
MPGLLRGMARTAAVAGTATAVSGRVAHRQARRWAAQDQQAYEPPPQQYASPPPSGNGGQDPIAQLKELAALKEQGVLTDEEFAEQKARILG